LQTIDRIEFLGRKTQTEVGQLMREAHVFVFPSIRELGGGVVVEAMACGLCCVVVDYGGPGGLIDLSRGTKVPLTDKPALVDNIRAGMERLVADRGRMNLLSAEASRYALSEYSWQAKANKIHEVYRWVTGQLDKKPVFR
jgi:glycosyltransferase involved in cell wall biosynthesis